MPRLRPRPLHVVLAAALVYTALLSTLAVLGHLGLRTQLNDLGNADQALWAAADGDWSMVQSNTQTGAERSRLAVHANLIFYPLSLCYRIWPSPLPLLVLTTLACAAAGLGLYALARRRLGDGWWAVVPPLAFWASPLTHDANLYDFHVTTLMAALLVWTVVSFEARRTRRAWVLFALFLSCKEDAPLIGAMLGLYLALSGQRRAGAWVAGVSVVYLIVLQALIVPAFNRGGGLGRLDVVGRYHWLDGGKILLSDPLALLRRVFRPDRLRLPLYLAICGAAAAWRSWRMLLLLLPTIALCMLAASLGGLSWMTRLTGTYYFIGCEAVIAMACVLAVRPGRRPWPIIYLGGATAVLSLLLSPLPHGLHAGWANHEVPAERAALADLRALIPMDAPLCVQNNLGPQFSQRRRVTRLGTCAPDDWVLVQLRYPGGPGPGLFVRGEPEALLGASPVQLGRLVQGRLRASRYALLYQQHGFYLFAVGRSARVSGDEVWPRFLADVERLRAEVAAVDPRSAWRRWLVAGYGWDDLL